MQGPSNQINNFMAKRKMYRSKVKFDPSIKDKQEKEIALQTLVKTISVESQKGINEQNIQFQDELPDQSEAIIFIKQQYEQLFHIGSISEINTDIQCISCYLGILNEKDESFSPKILVTLKATQIGISMNNSAVMHQNFFKNAKYFSIPQNQRLFPLKKSQEFNPKKFLQKKIWIKISKSENVIEVHQGDLCQASKILAKVQLRKDKKAKDNWITCAKVYQINNEQTNAPLAKQYELLNRVKIVLEMKKSQEACVYEIMKKCIDFQILQKQKIRQSVLDTNPSFLNLNQTIYGVEKPLQILYGYLKNFSLRTLPDFQNKSSFNLDKQTYHKWANLRHAIHSSLIKKYRYQKIRNGFKQQLVPLGILNHLTKFKNGHMQNGKCVYKQYEHYDKFQNTQDQLKEIYDKRSFYVRLQLNQPVGQAPGSTAVLQVWPPYCCSHIHNHGEAYGLVKVMNNQITVQNYQDLNFLRGTKVPFQVNTYYEDQYTWLTQLSFGIHRLINLTDITTVTLQSYQSAKGSQQFFQFIQTEGDKPFYAQYYPQNDWQNYLKIPQLIKQSRLQYSKLTAQQKKGNKQSFAHIHFMEKGSITEDDIKFIEKVIQFYDLKDKQGKVDYSFPRFVLAMKKQYELQLSQLVNIIKNQTN